MDNRLEKLLKAILLLPDKEVEKLSYIVEGVKLANGK